MGEESKIEWTTHTFNPWIGCTKVSAGCKHCYAERDTSNRVSTARGLPLWGPGSTRRRTSAANWKQPLAWNKKARQGRIWHEGARSEFVADPLPPWDRPRVFCASLADVFEGGRSELDAMRVNLWVLIEQCDELDWLLLTKRPENVLAMVPARWLEPGKWPRHVWLGTTVENQAMADERIPRLLRIPAPVLFLSIEPLLGQVTLTDMKIPGTGWSCNPLLVDDERVDAGRMRHIDWVIVGGESGPVARPMHPDWVRSIRDQCQAAGVPFFFKQWGEFAYDQRTFTSSRLWEIKGQGWLAGTGAVLVAKDGTLPRNGGMIYKAEVDGLFPLAIAYKDGKKKAGRELDGRTWDEVPRG